MTGVVRHCRTVPAFVSSNAFFAKLELGPPDDSATSLVDAPNLVVLLDAANSSLYMIMAGLFCCPQVQDAIFSHYLSPTSVMKL